MRPLAATLLIALTLTGVMPALASAETNTVSVSLLPGPFTVSLEQRGELIVLTVEDSTGYAAGWWATVDCSCPLAPVGRPVTIAGQQSSAGPRMVGHTLVAEPGGGRGAYEVAFRASAGIWSVTYGTGPWGTQP